jgi:hypothetical protein
MLLLCCDRDIVGCVLETGHVCEREFEQPVFSREEIARPCDDGVI